MINKKRVFEDFALLLFRFFMGGTFLVYAIKKVQGFDNYVAFFLVNINNSFAASRFGIEVSLAYISILLILFSFGSGKISIDNKILKNN